QAEDGIRDRNVTGVQTCALPIFINTVKHAVGRLRPFNDIPDAITRVGRGGSFSMPSAHTANWFAATMVLFVYFRRSVRFMLPLRSEERRVGKEWRSWGLGDR